MRNPFLNKYQTTGFRHIQDADIVNKIKSEGPFESLPLRHVSYRNNYKKVIFVIILRKAPKMPVISAGFALFLLANKGTTNGQQSVLRIEPRKVF